MAAKRRVQSDGDLALGRNHIPKREGEGREGGWGGGGWVAGSYAGQCGVALGQISLQPAGALQGSTRSRGGCGPTANHAELDLIATKASRGVHGCGTDRESTGPRGGQAGRH